MWYDEGSNRIDQIRNFKSIEQLEKFLDDIDLEDV